MMLKSVDFEVFGKVQGVYFRYYTAEKAKELNIVGWARNTERSTVEGVIQGQQDSVEEMQKWLSKVGSPHSRITDCKFSNVKIIKALQFKSFDVRR